MSIQHQARKRFGQNFLEDSSVIANIIGAIAPKSDDALIEIGPGLGALTQPLLKKAPHLQAIELDYDLIPHLQALSPQLIIHQADVLTVDFQSFVKEAQSLRIVGNLPYNISTPLIFHLLKQIHLIQDMHFMLQKEVVERMAAQPGSKDYGRLSIMVQYFCKVNYLFTVPPQAFKPAPKVESAIVRLLPHAQLPYVTKDFQQFSEMVRLAFGQRRKTLRNSLKTLVNDEQWNLLEINATLRPEQIALKDFVKIANFLSPS